MDLSFPRTKSAKPHIRFSMSWHVEICNHCGRDVTFGSGWFVNRIPDFNDVDTRAANGLRFPKGDFVCFECDSKTSDDFLDVNNHA